MLTYVAAVLRGCDINNARRRLILNDVCLEGDVEKGLFSPRLFIFSKAVSKRICRDQRNYYFL